MEIANTLVFLRKRDDMTQEELAKKIGLSRSAVGMIESGQRKPSWEVLETIADTFNVSMDFLTGRVDTGIYSAAFRETLEKIIANTDKAELVASGVDLDMVQLVIAGSVSLSFEYACELAEQLGLSLDEMLGKENPALMEEGEVAREIRHLLSSLSADNLTSARDYLRFLSKSGDK